MRIAIITAGGAGMFCGSCMHDNTLARALLAAGEDVTLVPTYTPIRVDEANVSQSRVFLGGINVYLDTNLPLWRYLPKFITRCLDAPAVIRWATQWGVSSDAKDLGAMTVALLKGDGGPQQKEVEEFVTWLATNLKPDVVIYSNALLVGTLAKLKSLYAGPVYCLLQGDDIFLKDLVEPWKTRALEIIAREGQKFDGFLVHSHYYRDFMSAYLQLPAHNMHRVPLGIDLEGHDGRPRPAGDPFTIGYFARICPEKGLHNLVAAFRILHARHPSVRLRAGGYLGTRDKAWFEKLRRETAGLGDAFHYVGSPATHEDKVRFLNTVDVLSVPTDYHEPKGLYVLEALANGIPVVQPRHGSFPELIEATQGGLLVNPGDPVDLAAALERLMLDDALRQQLATAGQRAVHEQFGPAAMARATLDVLKNQGTPLGEQFAR